MLSHLEPYLLAPSALTPTALLERAATLVDSAMLTNALPLLDEREALRLHHNPLYEAWLVPWVTGASTDLHTHQGGYGAYVPIRGLFRETIVSGSGMLDRLVPTAERVAHRPAYTHRLAAVAGPAVTLHLVSPPRRPCLPQVTADRQVVGQVGA